MSLLKKCIAEFIGTFVLVAFGCGVAVYTGCNNFGGVAATALAFGLVIVAMAYSIGNVSGCHINPAVSLAMLITKKMTLKEFALYVCAQILGAVLGCLVLGVFFNSFKSLGANQVQVAITDNYKTIPSYFVGLIAEIVLTFVFILAILGVTSRKTNAAVTGIVIGLTLTLVHLLGIYLTGTSVNPARSLAPAIFQAFGGSKDAIKQVWIFIVGPFAGAALAGVIYPMLDTNKDEE